MPASHVESVLAKYEKCREYLHVYVSSVIKGFGEGVLTPRERDLAQLLLRGHSAKSIARILHITPGTAALHSAKIYRKMGVHGQKEMFGLLVKKLTGSEISTCTQ